MDHAMQSSSSIRPLRRRAFLAAVAGAGATLALAACGGSATTTAPTAGAMVATAASATSTLAATAPTSSTVAPSATAPATAGTIKVGVLHSLSGTMAISEVAVKNAELLAIKEINAAGGVMGKQLEPVVQDGASDWPTFAEKAKLLLQSDKVAAIFGCWTSASRKAVLPVVEQLNGLLYYPVQYEGLEASKNIFYICAPPNQQIIPAVTYLLGQKLTKMYLLGSDYVFPRTANKIIKAQLAASGGTTVSEEYTPLGNTDYSAVVSKIQAAKPDVVFNTLNGDSNVAFFKQLKAVGLGADKLPTMSVSVAEVEVKGIGPTTFAGDQTAWNYFQSMDVPENKTFVANFQKAYGAAQVTDDPIAHAYSAVYLWKASVEKAGSIDVEKVRAAAGGISFQSPMGPITIDGSNQHIYQKAYMGGAMSDGQFKIVWNSGPEALKPDPFLKTYAWGKQVTGS